MLNVRLPSQTGDAATDRLITSLSDAFRDTSNEIEGVRNSGPRFIVRPLIAATGAGGTLSWKNPFPNTLIITKLLIHIRAGTTLATGNFGVTSSPTGSSNSLIDALTLNSAGVFSNIKNSGAAGSDCQLLAKDFYITGDITGTVGSFKANAYIEFYVAEPVL